MTTWTTPDFTEIKMDAEIGSYQEGEMPVEDPILRDETAGEAAQAGGDRHP